jgi:hypothetical protein
MQAEGSFETAPQERDRALLLGRLAVLIARQDIYVRLESQKETGEELTSGNIT